MHPETDSGYIESPFGYGAWHLRSFAKSGMQAPRLLPFLPSPRLPCCIRHPPALQRKRGLKDRVRLLMISLPIN